MSYHVFFDFSSGLSKAMRVPKGTKQRVLDHVLEVERTLKLERTQYLDNPVYWDHWKRDEVWKTIDDKTLCEAVEEHNRFVRQFQSDLAFWSKHPFTVGKGHQDQGPNTAYPRGWKSEKLTPQDAAEFWHGLTILDVEPERWTASYYRARMDCVYEVLRGRESEGVAPDEGVKPLTPGQAAQVIVLFSQWLDNHDIRLDVPKGHDCLESSANGGYEWCTQCGAITYDDAMECRKRGCPLRKELEHDDDGC